MTTTTAIIAEDEPVLRGELREMLAAQWPELDVVAEVGDGAAALPRGRGARARGRCSSTSRCPA